MKPLSKEGAPRQLGRFELVAELASGGMATVFLGRLGGAGGFQRFVAVKRLHSHLADDHEFVDMFLDEARLAARLHHPNVVPILEIGHSEHGYYLVMEYVEGETLARLLNLSHQAGTPVPTNVTVRIFLDVLAGLQVAHDLVGDDGAPLDIVHRDVSPQNILVGVEGAAKITDFGVAHAADRLAHTRTGQLKGKFSYMAPEQALGKVVDRRADVFALGTCLWEALVCKRLFKGDNEAETLDKVLRGVVPPLRTLQPSLHPAIEAVVARSLERDPQRRFASAADFADALESAAIKAGVLGTQRDVMNHVQRVLGPILVQQREAVRAWIVGMDGNRPIELRAPANGVVKPPARSAGVNTRVDVPRLANRGGGSDSVIRKELATVNARRAPVLPEQAPAPREAMAPLPVMPSKALAAAGPMTPSADSSAGVAVGAVVERMPLRPRSNSNMPTIAIAAAVIALGALVGFTRLSAASGSAGEATTDMATLPAVANAPVSTAGAQTTPTQAGVVAAPPSTTSSHGPARAESPGVVAAAEPYLEPVAHPRARVVERASSDEPKRRAESKIERSEKPEKSEKAGDDPAADDDLGHNPYR